MFFPTFMQKVIVYGKEGQTRLLKEGAGEAACYHHNACNKFPDAGGNQNAFDCSGVLPVGIYLIFGELSRISIVPSVLMRNGA